MTTPLIDFHNHYVGPRWTLASSAGVTPAQGAFWARHAPRLGSLDAVLEDVRGGDLTARLINTPTALFTDPDQDVPADEFRRINDHLAEVVAGHPGRLHALASVDIFQGDSAAREIERAVRDLGLRGVFVESAKGDRLLDAPEARPGLAAAARLGVPVFAHPVAPPPALGGWIRNGRVGLLHARGSINAASLIALIESGVFTELPELKVVVTALAIGGVVLSHSFADAVADADVRAILKRNVHSDIMGFDAAAIATLVRVLGVTNVVAGSDWPIVSDGPIRGRLFPALTAAGLTPAEQELVAAGNAARLLGL